MEFSTPPRQILILKPSSLGDVVHTLPAVAALKAHWPQSEISWLINTEWAPLLQGNPDVNRVIEFPRKKFRGPRGWLRVPAWLASLTGQTPDLALDFQGLLRTALIGRFMGSRHIRGLSDAREGSSYFYHQTVPVPQQPMHAVERYQRLVRSLQVSDPEKPTFRLPEGQIPVGFCETEKYILLHPFSRGSGKSLEEPDVARLCAQLAPWRVIVAGNSSEKVTLPANATNFLNQTSLAELIWLIRHAAFTVSVDSGPMHIAAAFSDRLLSIHTWSDPRLVGPWQPGAWIWKNGGICRMCDWQPGRSDTVTAPSPSKIADFVREQLSANQPSNSP